MAVWWIWLPYQEVGTLVCSEDLPQNGWKLIIDFEPILHEAGVTRGLIHSATPCKTCGTED